MYSHSIYAQRVDSFACKKVEYQLQIIKQYLENKDSDSSLKRANAIRFLSGLTGIPSESDGNYFGQMSPTKNDYQRWKKWYELNKAQIFQDNNRKLVWKKQDSIIYKNLKN